MNKGTLSDLFAKHFASHFKSGEMINVNQVRKLTKTRVLWQGNPISGMKTNCNLCMKERVEILKALRMDKLQNTKNVINSSNELYGGCRHKCKFHRHRLCNSSSTD